MSAEERVGPAVAGEGKPPRRRARLRFGPHEQLIGLVLLSVAIFVASQSVESGLKSRNQPPQAPTDQVTVTGSAEQSVTSDSFAWHASLSSTQPTTGATLAQLTGWTDTVDSTLEGAGARPGEITIGSVAVQPNSQSGVVTSFTMSQSITVTSTRLNEEVPIVATGNRFLAENIPFIAQQPQYFYSHLHRLRPILTREATADARRRALAALDHHGTLGKSISLQVSPISVDAPGAVDIGSGDYDTLTIPKVVSVAVTATYRTS